MQTVASPLIRKLEIIASPTEAERQALATLPLQIREFGAREDIVREGDRPSAVCLLLEGFVCRYTILPSGRRQIMALHIPGDIPDLHSLFIEEMDHSLGALAPTRVAVIPHDAMSALIDNNPRIAHMLWRDTLIDAAIFRKWIASLGRRSAYGHLAHMLCELVLRMKAMGLSDGTTCELPLTQSDLADALGLSNVHVNRTLAEMRVKGLVRMEKGVVTICDWEGLQAAGEFDPGYLQLRI
jgi:CRP-like cAMP-binding protein